MCSFFCYLSFHNIPRVINSTKEFIILCMKLAHSCSVHSWTSLYWAGYKPKNVTHHLVLKNQIPSQWSDLWHTLKGFSRRWTWVWVTSGVGDGQGSLACCYSWGCEEPDTTEQLSWTERILAWRSGMRHSVLWEKLADQVFSWLDILRRKFYESNFLHIFIPRTALKSLTKTSVPCDWQ